MIKLPIILATLVAAVPCCAQNVRVLSGDQEHVYGPGGQLVDSPELRAKNERAQMRREKEATGPAEQKNLSIRQSRPSQVPNSWWSNDAARRQPPKSWWNNNGYQPPKSAWSQ